MKLPEIPQSYMILILLVGLLLLMAFGIDSFVTGAMMALIGYLTGVKMEQTRKV